MSEVLRILETFSLEQNSSENSGCQFDTMLPRTEEKDQELFLDSAAASWKVSGCSAELKQIKDPGVTL